MNHVAKSLMLQLSVAALLLGCGGGSSSSNSSGGNQSSSPASLTQSEVEELANSSLLSTTIDDGFVFQTQQQVSINILFDAPQTNTQILLFSVDDEESLIESVNLLEGSYYRTKITIPQATDAILLKIEGSDDVTLPISGQSVLTYHVTS